MKLLPFLLFFCLLNLQALTAEPKISLSVHNQTLEWLLNKVLEQARVSDAQYSLVGEPDLLDRLYVPNYSVDTMPISEVLRTCTKGLPIVCYLTGKTIEYKLLNISGVVVFENGDPLEYATIFIVALNRSVKADENGYFSIECKSLYTDLKVSYNGMVTKTYSVRNKREGIRIVLETEEKAQYQSEITALAYSNHIPRERATGSFVNIQHDVLTRAIYTNLKEVIHYLAPGIQIYNSADPQKNQIKILIRGIHSIFGKTEPLIVVDNVPYFGDIDNINPNDVEKIQILKDAVASSAWGINASNGVIVISTKKGKFNTRSKISVNVNMTVVSKPDMFYQPVLNSGSYIEVEKLLFESGYYDKLLNDPNHPPIPPAVEILLKKKNGLISAQEADLLLRQYKSQDMRADVANYLYRPGVNMQQHINFSGGGSYNNYYASIGFDKKNENLLKNGFTRITVSIGNSLKIGRKAELSVDFNRSSSKFVNNPAPDLKYNYYRLVDGFGNAVSIPLDYRTTYTDTAGGGNLLNWTYKPLEEAYRQDCYKHAIDTRWRSNLKYIPFTNFELNLTYTHFTSDLEQVRHRPGESYFARNLINKFSQFRQGRLYTPIPHGGVLDRNNAMLRVNTMQFSVKYERRLGKHMLNGSAGVEVNRLSSQSNQSRSYGYTDNRSNNHLDFASAFPQFNNRLNKVQIPYPVFYAEGHQSYVSYFTNLAYNHSGKYIVSGSLRRDHLSTNRPGFRTNGSPFFTTGVTWEISKERFYLAQWPPKLSLQITYGASGNLDRSTAFYPHLRISDEYSFINPANVNDIGSLLYQEKSSMLNFGINFEDRRGIVSGYFEYYIKRASNLIGITNYGSGGNNSYAGDLATMQGNGIEFNLSTRNLDGIVKWFSNFSFNYIVDKVKRYDGAGQNNAAFTDAQGIDPLEGRPLYSIYSFRWGGLDPESGDPIGFLHGIPSKDYKAIMDVSEPDDLYFDGPSIPPFFGFLRNELNWKQITVSFLLAFKMGHKFRTGSIDYTNLYDGGQGHPDFESRWREPGDEKKTNVPSMVTESNPNRDAVYNQSNVLVEKADHIRFHDIKITYLIKPQTKRVEPETQLKLYLYANNFGIIWRATRLDIDSDHVSGYPPPFSVAVGANVDF